MTSGGLLRPSPVLRSQGRSTNVQAPHRDDVHCNTLFLPAPARAQSKAKQPETLKIQTLSSKSFIHRAKDSREAIGPIQIRAYQLCSMKLAILLSVGYDARRRLRVSDNSQADTVIQIYSLNFARTFYTKADTRGSSGCSSLSTCS